MLYGHYIEDEYSTTNKATDSDGVKPTPFIKWAGGKGWLVKARPDLLPVPDPGREYYEPFLGGAARFWSLPVGTVARLNDCNRLLVNLYRVVRDSPADLINELGRHRYDRKHYYDCRDAINHPDARAWNIEHSSVRLAALFMVMNKFGFNGLWRVNSDGLYNVPFGTYKNPSLCDPKNILRCSAHLQEAIVSSFDFETQLSHVQCGDAVFLDPPYVPSSATANFTDYSAGGFGPKDQARLVESLHKLDSVGAYWVLTNSDTEETRALYEGWDIFAVKSSRGINCDAGKRGKVGEIVVTGKRCASALHESW